MAKGGLGKGLSSLMGNAAAEAGSNTDIVEVSLEKISPNPNQPRTVFDQSKIDDLAKSIEKDGLLQPIIVRPLDDGYQIVAGERRYHACKKIGLDTIPVKIVTLDEARAQEIALVENLQRENINPIEEAWGYRRLMELGDYKQKDIAKAISKNPSTISNALRLLDLPDEVQELMFDGKLSAGHARAILSLPVEQEEKRIELAKKIVNEGLSVREAESMAKLYAISGSTKVKRELSPKSFKYVARKLRKTLDVPVKVKTVRGKNKIEIEFSDEEELERIFNLINGTNEHISQDSELG